MRSRRGFTLLELLLALGIFAVIASTVYAVFAGGIRLSRVSEGRVGVYREAGWAFALLARELENMARFDTSGMKDGEPLFKGEQDEIAFLLPAEDGLKYVRYYLLAPSSGKIHEVVLGKRTSRNVEVDITSTAAQRSYFLVREEYGLLEALAGTAEGAEPEIIAGNIKEASFRLQYAYAEGELGDTIRFKDSWDYGDIPARVRVSMEFIDGYDAQAVPLSREVLIPHGVLGKSES